MDSKWVVSGVGLGVSGLVLTLFLSLGSSIEAVGSRVEGLRSDVREDITNMEERLDKRLSRIEGLIEAQSPQP